MELRSKYRYIPVCMGGLSRSNVSPEVWYPQTLYFEADSPPDTLLTQLLSWKIRGGENYEWLCTTLVNTGNSLRGIIVTL